MKQLRKDGDFDRLRAQSPWHDRVRTIRIISAWLPTRAERRSYEEGEA